MTAGGWSGLVALRRTSTTSCARCCGSAPSATRSRWSTTRSAVPHMSGISRRRLGRSTRSHGLYHVAAQGECRWAEFASAIFEEAGLAAACGRSRRMSSAGRRRGRRTACCAASSPRRGCRTGATGLEGGRDGVVVGREGGATPRAPSCARVPGAHRCGIRQLTIVRSPSDVSWLTKRADSSRAPVQGGAAGGVVPDGRPAAVPERSLRSRGAAYQVARAYGRIHVRTASSRHPLVVATPASGDAPLGYRAERRTTSRGTPPFPPRSREPPRAREPPVVEAVLGSRARWRDLPGPASGPFTLRRMRVLVTGGSASSAPTSSSGSLRPATTSSSRQADDAGQSGEPRRRRQRILAGDIADAAHRRGRGELRSDRRLRGRDPRRPLDPRRGDFIRTDVTARGPARARTRHGAAPRAGFDRRGLRRRAAGRLRDRGRPARAVEPVLGVKAGGDLQRARPTCARSASTPRSRAARTLGPYQYPEKMIPLFDHERARRRAAAGLRRRPPEARWLHVDDHCAGDRARAARGRARRGLQRRRRRRAREHRDVAPDPRADRRRRGLSATSTTAPATTAATRSTPRSCEALGWAPRKPFEEGLAETVAWYRENRELVGADQVRRVPRVLRAPVRRRLASPLALLVAALLGLLPQLADLLPLALDLLRAVEDRRRLRTARAHGG